MTERTCGGCTVCCKIMAIAELDKPANRWCQHCMVGVGCASYQERPQSCSDFACVWLKTPQLDDSYRPDRCKVMLFEYDGKVTAYCDETAPVKWRNHKIMHMLRYAAKINGHSIAIAGKKIWVVTETDEWEVPAEYIMRTDSEIRVSVPSINDKAWNIQHG